MSSTPFTCQRCGKGFNVSQAALDRYPGWQPRVCLRCRDDSGKGSSPKGRSAAGSKPRRRSGGGGNSVSRELNLPLSEVLVRFSGGPDSGVFTDGACSGNPGPGGWGVVHVGQGEVIAQRYGHDPDTTNNRMELVALINGYEMLPEDAQVTIYSDSQLCVKTINEWAAGWQRRGWRRKTGAIANLDLVKPAYELAQRHPDVELRWIKAHDGSRWNEYADSLATAYLRSSL